MSNLINVSDSDFESVVLKSAIPALVAFSAVKWCKPCMILHPILEDIASESNNQYLIAELDIDDEPNTTKQFGVRSVPTIIAFKDGKATGRLVGLQSKANILKLINQ